MYDFGAFSAAQLGFANQRQAFLGRISPCRLMAPEFPAIYMQGLGSPSDSFNNIAMGFYWQDSWRCAVPNVTLNYGVRYDVEIPPTFKAPTGLAADWLSIPRIAKRNSDRQEQFPATHSAWPGTRRATARL